MSLIRILTNGIWDPGLNLQGPQNIPMNPKIWESQMKQVAKLWNYPTTRPSYVFCIVGIQLRSIFLFVSKMENLTNITHSNLSHRNFWRTKKRFTLNITWHILLFVVWTFFLRLQMDIVRINKQEKNICGMYNFFKSSVRCHCYYNFGCFCW